MKTLLFFILFIIVCCTPPFPPEPVMPVPSERLLRWHETEFYAFIHFNMNTFTGNEWGPRDESAELFRPDEVIFIL